MRIKIPLIAALLLYSITSFAQHDHMLQTNLHKYLTYQAWEVVKFAQPHTRYSEMNTRIGEIGTQKKLTELDHGKWVKSLQELIGKMKKM